MNVLFLSNHLNTGGITSYLFTLSTGLKKRGHGVFVASSGGDAEDKFSKKGIIIIKVPLKTKSEASPKIIISLFKLLPLLKREKIDVIHANTRVTQVLAFWLFGFSGVPYVSTCHGFFKTRLSRRILPLWGKKVIAISDSVFEHLTQDFKLNPVKVKVIYNGIDIHKFGARSLEPGVINETKKKFGLKDGPVVGIIARLSDVKGHKYLIQAFAIILKEKPSAQLLLIGEGKMQGELSDLVNNLNIKENVYFVPTVADTRDALSVMDVFVMPSLQEGLGLALMEAMASGLAVVASDIGGLRNLIKNHQNGILVKAKDIKGLSAAIQELLNDAEKRKEYGVRAKDFILKNFSQDKMVEETLDFYRDTKRILIFNVNWLGDVLFSTAAIRNIRYNLPNSYIACIVPPRCYPVLKNNPHLDEIIIFDEKDIHKSLISKIKFIYSLKTKNFDTAFLFHRSFTRALMTYLAGIPQRIGYNTAKRSSILTRKISPPAKDSCHRIDHYMGVVEKSGFKIEDRYPEFFVDKKDLDFADEFFKNAGIKKEDFIVAINPGGNWYPKRWPKEYFARVADALISELKAKVMILGAESDLDLAKQIASLMKEKPVIAAGKFNLKQLGAVFKKIDLFISADSGPLHIANAVGAKKIIALFGPTSVAITGPYPLHNVILLQKDIGCVIPCYKVNCNDNRCMKAITPEEVLEQVKAVLKFSKRGKG